MTKTLINTYNIANEYRRHLIYVLIFGCALMVGIYIFNVYRVIATTIALQKIETQLIATENQVQSLDSRYLGLSSQITPDTLSKHGFTTGKVSLYIPRNASLGRVALVGHEL